MNTMLTKVPFLPAAASNAPSVLRFITCGSVDDGKSTLIGRLLLDAKAVFADQIAAIGRAKHSRAPGDALDLSLLTDGLEAEREQGITIDVAYRYFATPKRKFIVADTPGHEQYTRNMITGASTAHAALLLIDPTRVVNGQLLEQTKRHAMLAQLMGIRHVIAVVNKMDLIDYQQAAYERIETALHAMALQIGLPTIQVIPVSALTGDNVVEPSAAMPWYFGSPLLPLLEELSLGDSLHADDLTPEPLRFLVQYVIRTDGSSANDFRGFAGYVARGRLNVGDAVHVLPSGTQARVLEINTYDGPLQFAHADQAVTVVLDRDTDVSRGDIFVAADSTQLPQDAFDAQLCWLDTAPLNAARKYWLKIGARTVYAKITAIPQQFDIASLSYHAHITGQALPNLGMNSIATVRVQTYEPLLIDSYAHNQTMGAFILIDPASHQTAAAGMVIDAPEQG